MPKSAREQLVIDHPSHGRPFEIPARMAGSAGKSTMIVPRPRDVEALMKTPRKGKLITMGQIRAKLAKAAKVDLCCPLTTGIFARLAAEAAEDDAAAGKSRITPYWRTARDDGKLMNKFPGGIAAQAKRLKKEGIEIAMVRGKPRVKDFLARPK
jgi:hypothetical protein